MPRRLLTAVLAALALAAPAPALAQDPPADASPAVERIYEDFRRDGVIDVCEHKRADLQEALDTIEPGFETDNPDFREALEAGIQRHDSGRCDADATPTPTPTATSSPPASPTPASGTLPKTDGGGTGATPPDDGTLPPQDGGSPQETTPPPPAATATTAPPPAATPAASATPVIVTRSGSDGLLIPGILLGLAALAAVALGAFALAARRSPRFNHAWREAMFRTRGTWADFSDWLRLGR